VAGVKGSEGETPGPMEVGARGSVDLDDYFTDKTDGSPQARSIVLAYCKTESGLGPLHKLCCPCWNALFVHQEPSLRLIVTRSISATPGEISLPARRRPP
jgi:hypothetical protein